MVFGMPMTLEGHLLPIRFFGDFRRALKRAVTPDHEENVDLQVREGSDHLCRGLRSTRRASL
jgi:hypothetical protein